MPSSIDPTKPADGVVAEKGDLRTNLSAIKSEIDALRSDGAGMISGDAGNDLTTNPKFWAGTQAEYDAIGTPDANTIYIITA